MFVQQTKKKTIITKISKNIDLQARQKKLFLFYFFLDFTAPPPSANKYFDVRLYLHVTILWARLLLFFSLLFFLSHVGLRESATAPLNPGPRVP